MLCTGCGRLPEAAGRSHWLAGAAGPGRSLPVPTAAGAAIQPGSVRARPASPRPPAGAGHAGAASPLAGPGQGRRGARDPDGLCPSAGAGPGLGAVDRTRARDPGSAVQQRRLLWWGRGLRLLLGAAPGPSRPTGGAHSLGKLRTTLGAMCSQVFPFKGAPVCYKESRSIDWSIGNSKIMSLASLLLGQIWQTRLYVVQNMELLHFSPA